MHSESFLRTLMQETDPVCSFIAATSVDVIGIFLAGSPDISHNRTCPSPPPLMMRLKSEVVAMAVTPLLWASLIISMSLPDSGKNSLILPSSQAVSKGKKYSL